MADVAARREARRRRILENSEYRLQRIAGRASDLKSPESGDSGSSKQSTHSVLSNQSINGIFPTESLVNSQWDEDPLEVENQIAPVLLSEHDNLHSLPNKLNFPDSLRNRNGNIPEHRHRDLLTESQDRSESSFFSTESHQRVGKPEKLKQSKLNAFLTNPLIYVVLAVTVNLAMTLDLDSSYGRSIIIPFVVIFLTRISICGSIPESRKGNMLFVALILCNIRPNVLYKLKKVNNFVNLLLRDFSLYIFCTVYIFSAITSHWVEVSIPPSETIEVIMDPQVSAQEVMR